PIWRCCSSTAKATSSIFPFKASNGVQPQLSGRRAVGLPVRALTGCGSPGAAQDQATRRLTELLWWCYFHKNRGTEEETAHPVRRIVGSAPSGDVRSPHRAPEVHQPVGSAA